MNDHPKAKTGELRMSVPADTSCPICVTWSRFTVHRTPARAQSFDASEAHSLLLAGFLLAKDGHAGVCATHARLLETLEAMQRAAEGADVTDIVRERS